MEIIKQRQYIILDATLLSMFMACAKLYDYRHNYHFVRISGKSVSLEMGSIVHRFLEVFYDHMIKGFPRNNSVAQGLVAAVAYSTSDEVTNCSAEDIKLALDTCEQYIDFYKNDSWIPKEVEVVRGRVLYTDDDIQIMWKAKLDAVFRIGDQEYAVDHKTMKQRRDTISLNNQFTGQCILTDQRAMFVNKVGFQTSLKPQEKFTRVSVNYTADRIVEWINHTLVFYCKLMIHHHEVNYWPMNFTSCETKYGFCDFKGVCEVDRNMREYFLKNEFKVGEPWDIGGKPEE